MRTGFSRTASTKSSKVVEEPVMSETREVEEVLDYWFLPRPTTEAEVEARKQFWFGGDASVDREIRERFTGRVERARKGELSSWNETPHGTLALLILLDQFTRNIYRGTPEAFSHDPVALELARAGFQAGRFEAMDPFERMFAALPFRHAEDVEWQKLAVALSVKDARVTTPMLKDFLVYSVDWARKHLDVIVRFGRFPHRNKALGRTSTPEEIEYIEYLKVAGQWL
jgi:uncharacterized protein (DUF924 family)